MTTRIVGLDVARAVAVLGMVTAHVGNDGSRVPEGGLAVLAVAHGRPAALFAVLAGVTLSLMVRNAGGWDEPWALRRTRARIATRAVLLIAMGYLLVELGTSVDIVLDNLGLTMLLMLPLLGLPTWALVTLSGLFVVLGRVLVLWLRPDGAWADVPVLSELWSAHYPAFAWLGYMALGAALGRLALDRARAQLMLVAGGAVAVAVAVAVRLAAGNGAATTLGAHSYSPVEMLANLGVACAVIGACCWLAPRLPRLLSPLAATGAMALTVYVAHLLVIAAVGDAMIWQPSNVALAVLIAALVAGAWAWRAWLGQGPLERLLTAASTAVGDAVAGPPPRRATLEA